MRPIVLALAVLATGCVNEDNFADKYASAACDWFADCHEADFEDVYDDRSDCEDENARYIQDLQDLAQDLGCVFDEDAAQDCVNATRSASCDDEEGEAVCEHVFVDCF